MTPLIDPTLFDQLKSKIDEDTKAKQELQQVVEELEQHVSYAQGVLSKVHSTPRPQYSTHLWPEVEQAIANERVAIGKLSELASQYPFYKYNNKWTRAVQDAISTVLLHAWLSGAALPTLEEVGALLGGVAVNLKDRDAFHVTIEEYLMALTGLVEELSRLAMNAVTLGDATLAVAVARFVKDVHAGFQVLNLKNDVLRRKVDGVKYAVKRVEDVMYDLSLRNLIPPETAEVGGV